MFSFVPEEIMGNQPPKQVAISKIEILPDSCGLAQINDSLKQEWASTAPPEIFKRAKEILGCDEHAVSWLTSGQLSLGWKIPLDLCQSTQGQQEVLTVLGRVENVFYL